MWKRQVWIWMGFSSGVKPVVIFSFKEINRVKKKVSRLSRFRPQGYLDPRGMRCTCAVWGLWLCWWLSLVFFYICLLWEAYRDCFMIFLSLYVFLRFLTWRARHSQPLFATRICFLCNQRPFARLVIRRAVEMKNTRFVGCSWFIGLIGLGFGFTQNKSTSTQVRFIRTPRVLTSL